MVLASRSGNRLRTNLRPYALKDRSAVRKTLSLSSVGPTADVVLVGMLDVQVC